MIRIYGLVVEQGCTLFLCTIQIFQQVFFFSETFKILKKFSISNLCLSQLKF